MTNKPPFRIALAAAAAVLLALVPTAVAGKPSGGGKTCTRNAPSIDAENNYAWGATGSWGQAGQQLAFQLRIVNNDVYCSSASFTVSLTAPNGFSFSMPTNTISLKSTTQGYLWAYVTSPLGTADGDYQLSLTAQRSGSTAGTANAMASAATYYKVYSADTTAPTLGFPNPYDGQTLSGSSSTFAVLSNDDHAVKKIDLYIDNVYQTTTTCQDITYNCVLNDPISLRGLSGQYTATFKATDWMDNVGVLTVNFTVG